MITQVESYFSTRLEPILPQSSLHAQVLALYTCRHGSDWNAWIQCLGWVSDYILQDSVHVYTVMEQNFLKRLMILEFKLQSGRGSVDTQSDVRENLSHKND